jgi:hypothetical protein
VTLPDEDVALLETLASEQAFLLKPFGLLGQWAWSMGLLLVNGLGLQNLKGKSGAVQYLLKFYSDHQKITPPQPNKFTPLFEAALKVDVCSAIFFKLTGSTFHGSVTFR